MINNNLIKLRKLTSKLKAIASHNLGLKLKTLKWNGKACNKPYFNVLSTIHVCCCTFVINMYLYTVMSAYKESAYKEPRL